MLLIFILFYYFISTLMFLYCLMNILRQMKNFLNNRWIDYSITRFINWCDSEYNRQHQMHFPFSRVFFGENCNWSPYFLSSAESFSLDIPEKTTSWTTSICSTIWEEVDDTSILTTQYQNGHCEKYRNFTWFPGVEIFFKFNLLNSSLLINFTITYQFDFPVFRVSTLLIACTLFPSFQVFLFVYCMLWMLVTVCRAKFTLWKTLMFAL